jgi:hypothetical protein
MIWRMVQPTDLFGCGTVQHKGLAQGYPESISAAEHASYVRSLVCSAAFSICRDILYLWLVYPARDA